MVDLNRILIEKSGIPDLGPGILILVDLNRTSSWQITNQVLDLEIRYQVLDLLGLLLGHQISSVRSYRDQDIKLKAARGSWEALGGPFRGLLGAFGSSRGTLVGALGGLLGSSWVRGARISFF